MPEYNGTTYHPDTPNEVSTILERYRIQRTSTGSGERLVMHYGDGKTGRAWGDSVTGYIGRSTGTSKIPLVIHNTRSLGGPGLLEHCIVKIETARGKRVLYVHPHYTPAEA